jgi:23S rRNA maturation mini-RNase III
VKFEQFLDLVLVSAGSTMEPDSQKEEIKRYVQALETNYTNLMRHLKEKNDKLVKQLRNARSERINEATEKSDFE